MADLIIKGASENNLKSINLTIQSDSITVVVGPSGSGKSSLVFDTIYAEGQRRYIESLSTYARNFLESVDKPDVEYIENISPTVAIEQKNRIKNSRGTVGSLTEINDYLRLLFSKIGSTICPDCKIPVKKHTVNSVVDDLIENYNNKRAYILFKHKGAVQDIRLAGFVRILIEDQVLDLAEVDDASMPEEYYVVYDRFRITQEDFSRIWEAVERTFFIGNGECTVFFSDEKLYLLYVNSLVCPSCKNKFSDPDPRLFSFDSPIGACPACNGFGNKLELDEKKLVPDPMKSLLGGAIEIFNKPSTRHHFYMMINYLRSIGVDVNRPFIRLSEKDKSHIFKGGKNDKEKYLGLDRLFAELEKKKYKVYVRVILSKYKSPFLCTTCNGSRLKPESLNVYVANKNIYNLQSFSILDFYLWLGNLKLSDQEKQITNEILKQLLQRTSFLVDVGLGYLTLGRTAKTLSNGEAQRINLANQLGSALVDTIYVLDEPSIGLHQKDISKLIKIIKRLRDNGNRVIVVEHETEIIKESDYIIELGPESGIRGGELIYSGSIDTYLKEADTLTTKYLKPVTEKPEINRRSIGEATGMLVIEGLKENNLKKITLKLPLKRFVCITGVSGSGKSSLITKSLYSILSKKFGNIEAPDIEYKKMSGDDNLKGIILMDQETISRSRRSTPITFISGFDYIRELFANTSIAKSRGYTASNFSFNVDSGQCPDCKGDGSIEVDMQFMADIYMRCEKCNGTRYKPEILDVKFKDKNISEVLNMTVLEAYESFVHIQPLRKILKLLIDMGLDYILLGQASDTLSGGEAQRLKICKELLKDQGRKKRSSTLYIMDEPTTGLHPNEVEKLLVVLQSLVNEGNSLVVIEHNLDLVKHADYVIDLGPGGGEAGGHIVVEGTPEDIAGFTGSYTGEYLKNYL